MKSIQAEAKRTSGKSHVAKLNDRTLRTASRKGLAWNDDEVAILVTMIEEDKTTYEMALATNRTYYGAQVARSHVGFAMRHETAIWGTRLRPAAVRAG